ncbi:ABC transporter ATP-binding protein [Rhizobium sp. Root73]|nr:ABC transporter ATP-binding protein [Rhizobium sp. Root1204]KQY03584.1 ABC transporter ATP-binding protein [Rhizobium sp. Root1334]KRC00227.1 ABC transporter ATP-binding protein [Rhizobium sp. Root73]
MILLKRLPFPARKPVLHNLAPRLLVRIAGFLILIVAWQLYVILAGVPAYILPSPLAVANSIVTDWPILAPALWVTTKTTLFGLILAVIGGVGAAVVLVQARWVETLFSPLIVTLQVTPIVAIAPLILIYAPSPQIAQLICAFIVTFFPVLLNTLQGLKNADRDFTDLLRTYGASRWQTLRYLGVPSALPHFFAGLKIGGGLALIGAVVAEFAAGSAGATSGLAFRLLEAQYRLNTPRLFAALVLLALLGYLMFEITSRLSRLALRRWHPSEAEREG